MGEASRRRQEGAVTIAATTAAAAAAAAAATASDDAANATRPADTAPSSPLRGTKLLSSSDCRGGPKDATRGRQHGYGAEQLSRASLARIPPAADAAITGAADPAITTAADAAIAAATATTPAPGEIE